MDLVDLFIELGMNCNKSSCSLSEDLLSQIINSMYKFFNPFISNGTLIRDTLCIASRRACNSCISKEIVITRRQAFRRLGCQVLLFPEIASLTIHLKIQNFDTNLVTVATPLLYIWLIDLYTLYNRLMPPPESNNHRH